MRVVCVPVLDDNFSYLLIDEMGVTAAVDPAEPEKVSCPPTAAIRKQNHTDKYKHQVYVQVHALVLVYRYDTGTSYNLVNLTFTFLLHQLLAAAVYFGRTATASGATGAGVFPVLCVSILSLHVYLVRP